MNTSQYNIYDKVYVLGIADEWKMFDSKVEVISITNISDSDLSKIRRARNSLIIIDKLEDFLHDELVTDCVADIFSFSHTNNNKVYLSTLVFNVEYSDIRDAIIRNVDELNVGRLSVKDKETVESYFNFRNAEIPLRTKKYQFNKISLKNI